MDRLRLLLLFPALALLPLAAFAEFVPRPALPQEPLHVSADTPQRLVVKFQDAVRARADQQGGLTSLAGQDLSSVETVAARQGIEFSRLIRLPEQELAELEERAAAVSGHAQPDLAGMMVAQLSDPSVPSMVAAAEALQGLNEVEWVSLERLGVPPPFDVPPASGDLVANQGHLRGNPGANSDFAWTWSATGQGVRISDCEYGWNPDHEDVNEIDLNLEPGQTIHPSVFELEWDQHGAAALGTSASMVNGYGCNGMSPDSEFYTYPEWTVEEGFRRTSCITSAITNSSSGDVVLLEMQATILDPGDFGPAELQMSVWTVVKVGTDAGVIVVGAAGNGAQDLDSPEYAAYMSRGDSGAILVGAGTDFFDHSRLSFSTYGSRVDVQAWGRSVTTLGYGDVAYNGSDRDQFYTMGFGGTSSASSIVAPSCALIQSFQLQALGTPLSPAEMRQLLIDTGWTQQDEAQDGHIGPAVNIKKALRTHYPAVAAPVGADGSPRLLTVHPNPFRDHMTIRLESPGASRIDLAIFDVAGRRVRSLLEGGEGDASRRSVIWDGRGESDRELPAGVYFVRLKSGARVEQGRIVLLK